MKKTMVILMATSLFAAAVPAMAMEHNHTHTKMDEQCAKECDLLLKNCALEVASIQQHIQRIKTEIKTNGAKPEHLDELKALNKKLKEDNETLRALSKPGR